MGKPVKVRIISVDSGNGNITASIRRATPSFDVKIADISAVEIGTNVEGLVTEIHKDNAVLSLKESNIRALLSLKNLANHRRGTESREGHSDRGASTKDKANARAQAGPKDGNRRSWAISWWPGAPSFP